MSGGRITEAPISHEQLVKLVKYDSQTGKFERISGRRYSPVGGDDGQGYIKFRVLGHRRRAHHWAWFYHYGEWPKHDIDHINGDRADNRIENLRYADDSTNGANQGIPKNNTSGFKGVTWEKRKRKWNAHIGVRWRKINLGYFDKIEDAAAAYQEAAEKYFGKYASHLRSE